MVTEEQLDAIKQFAANEGRCWKATLRSCWRTATYPYHAYDTQHLLQQVRNSVGPAWLNKFKLNTND